MDLVHALKFLHEINVPLVTDVIREVATKIQSLIDIGLGYLTLDRSTETLSGGETQRIKIAKFLTSALVDMVYILDEPSVGLHPHDIQLIKNALINLKNKGNTIMVVEHNPELIPIADYVVEIGPQAGRAGGQVTFTGTYEQLLNSDTMTGRYLKRPLAYRTPRKFDQTIQLNHVTTHNLKDVTVNIPLGVETVIPGLPGLVKVHWLMRCARDCTNLTSISLREQLVPISARRLSLIWISWMTSERFLPRYPVRLPAYLVTTARALVRAVKVRASRLPTWRSWIRWFKNAKCVTVSGTTTRH